jgi:hypothetical protein
MSDSDTRLPIQEYIDVMAECERLAQDIVDLPHGRGNRMYPGGVQEAIKFPAGLDGMPYNDLLCFARSQKKMLDDRRSRRGNITSNILDNGLIQFSPV